MTNTMTTTNDTTDLTTTEGMNLLVERVHHYLVTEFLKGDGWARKPVIFAFPPEDWRSSDIQLAPDLERTLSPCLFFRYDPRKGRIVVHGTWPYSAKVRGAGGGPVVTPEVALRFTDPRRDYKASITVAGDAPARDIARQIAGRLLPKYLPIHKECQAYIAREVAYQDSGCEIAHRLAAGWGAVRSHGGEHKFRVDLDENDVNAASGSVKVTGERVAIDLRSLTEAQAAAILGLLRG